MLVSQVSLRTIRSFVKREGRITRSQLKAIQQYWPLYGLALKDGMINIEKEFNRVADTILEIGFGMGDSLSAMAKQNPDSNFIGIEVYRPGIGQILKNIYEQQLKNIRIYDQDAVEVLNHCIPDGSLSKILILFPDPWPKKRHHKRRLIQLDFIHLIHKKLKPNGLFYIATDWEDYAEYILFVMQNISAFDRIADEKVISQEKNQRLITKFENRGKQLNHKIWDLLFLAKKVSRLDTFAQYPSLDIGH